MEKEEILSGEKKLKLQFVTTDTLWDSVQRFKINKRLKNNSEAVEHLILEALSGSDGEYIILEDTDEYTVREIEQFIEKVPTLEIKNNVPLIILRDNKSNSFFTECHVYAKDFIQLGDRDSVIDPDLQEEYRANRELEENNLSYIQMVEDAENGRKFSDIVIEFYDKKYNPEKPLKILGGQHRFEAIRKSLNKNVNESHGLRVYFNLSKDQRAEIMRISNTNINVSPDLRDRIEETRLTPANMLRNFCYVTGILEEKEDFADKKRGGEEFNPTVRMMRSFIVNFYKGLNHTGNIDEEAETPYICKSGGNEVDTEYLKLFNKFKKKGRFDDEQLIEAGKMFAKLHKKQYENADNIKSTTKRSYKIKAFSYAIITSWAYAAGVLQKYPNRLNKLYSLPDLSGNSDPLNAIAMSKARHEKLDSDTYRGLATRSDSKERGRLLHLFLGYSKATQPKITEKMCNAAIMVFHSNQSKILAEEKSKKAFE